VKARSDAWDWIAVIVDHGEAEADGEEQAGKIIEVERIFPTRGGQSGFDPVPNDEDGGKRAKQVLAHGVEETEVLGKQSVDGLKDVLQIVGLHCRQLLRHHRAHRTCLTACGTVEWNS
jgi:hypothetical protein